MPTSYLDQFWAIDPFSPPPVGTTLVVEKYELIDQDDDDDIGPGDTINGIGIDRAYPGDTVTVDNGDGTTSTITGITFYMSDGSRLFTPTDGAVLDDLPLDSTTYVNTTGVLDVDTDLGPPCLVAGTHVMTSLGPIPVEKLHTGMTIVGQDDRKLKLRMVLKTSFTARDIAENPNLAPVCIVAGALGNGLPTCDLVVSRQHRMLLNAPVVERMFGDKEVLVPAIKLTKLPGIYLDTDFPLVTYFHLVFDQHEIIFAEGAATESLFTGPEAMRAVSAEAREELLTMFPELAEHDCVGSPALPIPKDQKQKALIGRLVKNDQQSLHRS